MRYQPIYDIAELCVRKNIHQVVLCPGSRCAPLTLAFARHPHIKTRIFSDERSAGFIALGMAQSSRRPVVIVCTSGTAVYNLAPSIAEAYFSQTPLIALTADRPGEWIAQLDGQTIYQQDIFGRHVKKSFQLPQDYDEPDSQWAINRTMNEALNLSIQLPPGPVHINAPFREPLYPAGGDGKIMYSSDIRVIEERQPAFALTNAAKQKVISMWPDYGKVLVVAGQQMRDEETIRAVSHLGQRHIPVVSDVISNLHEAGNPIQHSDLFLGQTSQALKERLQPELLITFGQSVISKNLKNFLRQYPAKNHWHIQEAGPPADTFKNLTDVFYASPPAFLDLVLNLQEDRTAGEQKRYAQHWADEEQRTVKALNEFFTGESSDELSMVQELLESLPEHANLHLANSMSVRYANFIGLHAEHRGIQVFANRGTSGIDGCTSTAVGHALVSGRPNFLITGDLAFFYDRNAFWHNYPLENLRVLLLNNHGGLIFDILEGPSSVPEARDYFITRQALNARRLCGEFDFIHLKADEGRPIKELVMDLIRSNRTAVLEYESDTTHNKKAFDNLKMKIKKSYES